MSLFPRFVTNDFAPLFRLLDDYDYHRATTPGSKSTRAFQPKFDVKETKDAYELHGELPGIAQKDISIEFADPHTLAIKGRVERTFELGRRPEQLEPSQEQGRIANEAQEENQYQKPTVEEEGSDNKQISVDDGKNKGDEGSRYWISERSVGEFYRTFSFPSRVNQDAVKASLKDGILSIVVPKASAPQTKRIQISGE